MLIYLFIIFVYSNLQLHKDRQFSVIISQRQNENSNPSISVNSPVMEKTKRHFSSILLYYKLVKTSVKSNDIEFFCRAVLCIRLNKKLMMIKYLKVKKLEFKIFSIFKRISLIFLILDSFI